jgi:hypothetical protein
MNYTLDLSTIAAGSGVYTLRLVASNSAITDVANNRLATDASRTWTTTTINPWHNYTNSNDVNGREGVAPIDTLLIINEINSRATSDPRTGLLRQFSQGQTPPVYYDVNNDGFVTAIDALLVVNYLNAFTSQPQQQLGEGESSWLSAQDSATGTLELGGPVIAEPSTPNGFYNLPFRTSGEARNEAVPPINVPLPNVNQSRNVSPGIAGPLGIKSAPSVRIDNRPDSSVSRGELDDCDRFTRLLQCLAEDQASRR